MYRILKIELPNFHYFYSKNPYSGSLGGVRFRLEPGDGQLKAIAWPGPNCMDATDPALLRTEEFALTEEGLETAGEWLTSQCEEWTYKGV